MKLRDPRPEIQRLEELVTAVRRGEIRLPRFQRPFVWSKSDMLNLLDSIYNGYPIGSILLWHSSERLKSEREIVGFEVATQTADNYPTNYLLDGQQRLTTLCGSLFWNGEDERSIWRIFFDLEREEFTFAKKPLPIHFFPMNRLMSTSDFISQCTSFQATQQPKKYIERAEKLLQSFKDYKIAVVRIGDIPLDEVAPIFERINSTGRKLTMVDLMRAATWKDGFDLTDAIDDIVAEVRTAGFGEIPDTYVLRAISAAAGFGINKEDIDKLRHLTADQLRTRVNDAKVALLAALGFLRTSVSLDDLSFLPYALQLTHLAEYFRLRPEPSGIERTVLAQWFWATSVSRYFASASTTGQTAKDLDQMRKLASRTIHGLAIGDEDEELDITQFLFNAANLRNATTTAFALLLKSIRPARTIYGELLDAAHIKQKERHIFDEIVPPDHRFAKRNIGLLLNPFKEVETGPQHPIYIPALEENFLDEECIELWASGEIDILVKRRAAIIAGRISHLTGRLAVFKEVELGDPSPANS
ncbi:DUF262 domain-containing protein [Ramlibacter sp. PS4R-6]|uniref:DUF262 domain-containing protein n=1 Tax=Ramlibacter sp. PS4R-6 TaxID=3133438 RepID=UPI00309A7547